MSKEPRIKISMEGIQVVYIVLDNMWLVFANENENKYKAGIQESLHFLISKFTVYKGLYKKNLFGI